MNSSAARRPRLLVLAGVNGAGKSSIGGGALQEQSQTSSNPNSFARELVKQGFSLDEANAEAWAYGRDKLEEAIAQELDFAFEATLGANTIPRLLRESARTHEIFIWFCGLSSAEKHIERVKVRVAHGGHDIPEQKIRERWVSSIENLINLLPYLASLQLFDNSADAAPGDPLPTPMLVLAMDKGQITFPNPSDAGALAKTPDWAKPIVEAAIQLDEATRQRP